MPEPSQYVTPAASTRSDKAPFLRTAARAPDHIGGSVWESSAPRSATTLPPGPRRNSIAAMPLIDRFPRPIAIRCAHAWTATLDGGSLTACHAGSPDLRFDNPDRGPLPLPSCIVRKVARDRVRVQNEAVQHQRKIDIRDRPPIEQAIAVLSEQLAGGVEQSGSGCPRFGRQWALDRATEDDLGRPLLADRHQVAAQPGLNLTGARPRFRIGRVQRRSRIQFVQILVDGGRLG